MTTRQAPDVIPSLLTIAPAPVIRQDGDDVILDVKFVEGMRLYADYWKGPIGCVLHEGAESVPFGRRYARAELPFLLSVLPRDTPVTAADLDGYDMVLGSADSHSTLHLPDLCRRENRRCVLAIEYTLGNRLDILRLEGRSLPRRIYGAMWLMKTELRRRAAMQRADGLQSNGYPAWEAYGRLSGDAMLYLDNRMRKDLFATEAEMRARAEHLRSDRPLRLVHSGRLEAMKGAQDLIPVAADLRRSGLPFRLEVFGTGSLEPTLRAEIDRHGLGELVHLRGPVDFETELVPHVRREADIFLSCHRQSDPSCTYLESMGCGLAIAGYDNAMLSRLVGQSDAGWCAPLGRPAALAKCIVDAARDRDDIATRCHNALTFSRRHDFHGEFGRRIDHLVSVMGHGRGQA